MPRFRAIPFSIFPAIITLAYAYAFNQSTTPPFTRQQRRSTGQMTRERVTARPRPSSYLRLAKRGIAHPKKSRGKNKRQSLASLLELETDLRARGFRYVIGSDDSGGGGCLAGPVVVASCCILAPLAFVLPAPGAARPSDPSGAPALPPSALAALRGVDDCKALTPARRREIYDVVTSRPDMFAVSVAQRSPAQIDELNLARATQEAFAESIETLVERHALPFEEVYAITDGKVSPKLYASRRGPPAAAPGKSDAAEPRPTPQFFSVRPYVNGDAHVYTVALASIVARQARDEMMLELDARHPLYGFADHSGYGRPEHIEAIHRLGSLEGIHRMSFKPLKGR